MVDNNAYTLEISSSGAIKCELLGMLTVGKGGVETLGAFNAIKPKVMVDVMQDVAKRFQGEVPGLNTMEDKDFTNNHVQTMKFVAQHVEDRANIERLLSPYVTGSDEQKKAFYSCLHQTLAASPVKIDVAAVKACGFPGGWSGPIAARICNAMMKQFLNFSEISGSGKASEAIKLYTDYVAGKGYEEFSKAHVEAGATLMKVAAILKAKKSFESLNWTAKACHYLVASEYNMMLLIQYMSSIYGSTLILAFGDLLARIKDDVAIAFDNKLMLMNKKIEDLVKVNNITAIKILTLILADVFDKTMPVAKPKPIIAGIPIQNNNNRNNNNNNNIKHKCSVANCNEFHLKKDCPLYVCRACETTNPGHTFAYCSRNKCLTCNKFGSGHITGTCPLKSLETPINGNVNEYSAVGQKVGQKVRYTPFVLRSSCKPVPLDTLLIREKLLAASIPVSGILSPLRIPAVAPPLVAPNAAPTIKDIPAVAPPIVAPIAAPTIKDVPAVAPPMPQLALFDGRSDQCIQWKCDDGSSVTCISYDYCKKLQLSITARPTELPHEVGTAAENESMTVVGVVMMDLYLPQTTTIMRIPVAVVERLFCDALLGRNAQTVMKEVYGMSSLQDMCQPATQQQMQTIAAMEGRERVVSASHTINGGLKSADGITPKPRTSIEFHIQGTSYCTEAELTNQDGERLSRIPATFIPRPIANASGALHAVQISHMVTNAEVDWTAPRKGSLVPLHFLVRCVTSSENNKSPILLKEREVLGRLVLGHTNVIAALLPQSNPATTDVELVNELIQRVRQSPLLTKDEDRDRAEEVVRMFQFAEVLLEPGALKADPFVIELIKGAKPIAKRAYPLSLEHDAFARKQIQEWLDAGTVVPSKSAWSSPIVVVRHPRTGKLRLCIDYRSLNAVTVGDAYLMPLIRDVVRSVKGCIVFSSLDLVQAFGQYLVDESSQPKTAFLTPMGNLLQFKGSPFGLRNLPAAFQRLMDDILGPLNWLAASIYLDDCIVFSHSVEEHHTHLADLAARFKEANVFVKPSKCHFYVEEVAHLGYILDGKTIRVFPERLKGILDLPVPKDRDTLRSVVGKLGQFYDRLPHLSTHSNFLQVMSRSKKVPFDMSEGSPGWLAFHAVKAALLQLPLVYLADYNLPFKVYTDASAWACAWFLTQVHDGSERLVGCGSHAFDSSQLKWYMPMKEAFALHYACTGPCYAYLSSGGPHTAAIDNITAKALLGTGKVDKKIAPWAADLAPFPLIPELVSGNKMLADPWTKPPFVDIDPAAVELAKTNPLLSEPSWKQAYLSLLEQGLLDTNETVDEVISANVVIAPLHIPAYELNISKVDLLLAQSMDPILPVLKDFIMQNRPTNFSPIGLANVVGLTRKEISKQSRGLVVTNDGLLIRITQAAPALGYTVEYVIPDSLHKQFLDEAHQDQRSHVHGCVHAEGMIEILRGRGAFWANRNKMCYAYTCDVCDVEKKNQRKKRGLMNTILAERPGDVMSFDLVPFPDSTNANAKTVVGAAVLGDRFSCALSAHLYSSPKPSAQEAIQLFDSARGISYPHITTLYVDSDTVLISTEFVIAMERRGIRVIPATPGHQRSNFVERRVQTLKTKIRTTLHGYNKNLWGSIILDVINHLNVIPVAPHMYPPIQILTGWCPPSFIPFTQTATNLRTVGKVFSDRSELWNIVRKAHQDASDTNAKYYDARRMDARVAIGDYVLVARQAPDASDSSHNLSPPYEDLLYEVVAALSEVSYLLQPIFQSQDMINENADNIENDDEEIDANMEIDQRQFVHGFIVRHIDTLKPVALGQTDVMDLLNDEHQVIKKIHRHQVVEETPLDVDYLVEWSGEPRVDQFQWISRSELLVAAPAFVAGYDSLANLNF